MGEPSAPGGCDADTGHFGMGPSAKRVDGLIVGIAPVRAPYARAVTTDTTTSRRARASTSKASEPASEPRVDARLVETLVETILERINSGEIPIGAWLRQERLAQDLGVSRMPVREALRQLQARGIVEIIANRGARVRLPSALEVIEVYSLRGVLESHAGAAAAQLISTEQLKRLRGAIDTFKKIIADLESQKRSAATTTRVRWLDAYRIFHSVIIQASGNDTLADVLTGLDNLLPTAVTWAGLGVADVRRLKRSLAEHEQILDAISAGDSERTRRLFITHNEDNSALMVRALDQLVSRAEANAAGH